MSEHTFQNEILRKFGAMPNIRLWRNNVGTGWQGSCQRMQNGAMLINNPRPLNAGLFKGSGDLIGIQKITITPDMVGQEIGVFLSIECKTKKGLASAEQKTWAKGVSIFGGKAVIASSIEQIQEALR